MTEQLVTDRLLLRPWHVDDAGAALEVYGDGQVSRWLSPAMDQVGDLAAMRLLIQHWIAEDARMIPPAARWAVQRKEDGRLIGGAVLLPLPPRGDDLEVGWQLHREVWGHGYATEATQAIARWAFTQEVDEIFAVVRPSNTRAAATVRRTGMEWVGETDKYYDLRLQVFRLRPADILPPSTS
ncbi:GNAT family N-acetyltransferase [Solihabitans fulvus]|uniref:GNAT family N-acetyltransferase n=1 Tax=Solihabitans fulvus TaxID=1892852 RepID=A0A5B2WNU7_9PSEU|nr:GNAT family N-acetyltransferase [Solihabitans fulvus]KAA2252678.1 GNAT family N-acetyltransferase [Solihabitans fulvus]